MSTHTPGPWHSAPSEIAERFVVYGNDDNSLPCAIVPHNNRGNGEPHANARLIAAAPDLLAALKAMVLNDTHTYRDCHKAARAAIAKAEGCCQFHTSGGDKTLSCGGDFAKAEGHAS